MTWYCLLPLPPVPSPLLSQWIPSLNSEQGVTLLFGEGSCFTLPCGLFHWGAALFFCLLSSVHVNFLALVLICLFQLFSCCLSGKSLSLSCIVYLGSVVILKSDVLFSKKPIDCCYIWKPCIMPPSLLQYVPQASFFQHSF